VAPIAFTATDNVSECEQVTFADGSTWDPGVFCPPLDGITLPPQIVTDLINSGACPLFATLGAATGGGVLGLLTVGPDGDLYVVNPTRTGYIKIYDCP
jgi:hypothetical protein